MPYQANVFRVMVASPSDVQEERKAVPEVIYNWNAVHSLPFKTVLLPVKWETHSTPEMGNRPQAIINKQLVDESDILIGIFWTKLGTPTGVASSGSVEEVREFIDKGKPVLLYFSNVPVVAHSIDLPQYEKLKEFKEECFKEGLVSTYETLFEFRENLHTHLHNTVLRLRGVKEQTTREPEIVQPQSRVKVDVNISKDIVKATDEFEEYKLRIELKNIGEVVIKEYRLEIEFPNDFLNQSTIYAPEVTERRTQKHRFFRVTQEHHRSVPLYPGDSRTVFVIDYFMDERNATSEALDEHLRIIIYSGDDVLRTVDMEMSRLVNL
jgi:hypothetical protein